jgi:beta-N-acetylhexosaminidase
MRSGSLKKLVTTLSCFLVFLLAVAIPGSTLAQSHSPHPHFQHPNPPTDKANKGMARRIIAHMTAKEKIGQLVMPATPYTADGMPNENIRKLIQEYKAGSYIIYGNRDARTTAEYNNQLQQWAAETRLSVPLLISADLEYGTVQHVAGGTTFPRQMGIGATRSADVAEKAASITAKEAKAMGFNWNYSPVADVNTNPQNPVIGVRSFGEKTGLVSDMTVAMVNGYQKEGVMATAKHFPGHGDTSVDSHLNLAKVTYDRETLEEVHLPPFKAAIDAGIDTVMTAHVIIEAIDPNLPATLSKEVLTGLLRDQLGFDGIIVTDAMSMHAIDKNWGTGSAAVMTIQAGADIVMATGTYEQQLETFETLLEAYESGELSKKRVNESLERILMKKMAYDLFEERYVDPDNAVEVTSDREHKQAAEEIAQKSITLVKNESVLPFDANAEKTTLVAGTTIYGSTNYINDIVEVVDQKAAGDVLSWIAATDNPTNEEIAQAVELAQEADRIIVPTFSASVLPEGQAKLVKALGETGKPVVAVSLGLPYDVKHYPDVDAYLASYAIERWGSPVPTSWTAAVDVIFGAQPSGNLPVTIEDYYEFGHGLSY